ncbi:MAG: glutathione S-transferase N-terminal domain-containing protein [Proteobacteria bacterium]|nr:glutathione S-transferase N-terminal domain-containing protein [Pseudomonadota bacterium]
MLAHTLSRAATAMRFGHATAPGGQLGPRPEQALVLYEYEGCPMCRRVREAMTDLALSVEVRPCPKGGTRFRPEAMELSGKAQFPFLVDPNTGVALLESTDIVHYLYENYGAGDPPSWLTGGRFMATSALASMLGSRRTLAVPTLSHPAEGLVLHGEEGDPRARLVRERLCQLELSYRREPGGLQLLHPDTGVDLADLGAVLAYVESLRV